jgi:hypothetical protein
LRLCIGLNGPPIGGIGQAAFLSSGNEIAQMTPRHRARPLTLPPMRTLLAAFITLLVWLW